MCEIAVVDPEQAGIAAINQIAYKFHEEQGDGIGVLTIENNGDSFEYDHYCSTDPHWQTLFTFLRNTVESAWRVVIHGRYGTVGGVNREHCHPLNIDCDECDFEHIIHNGSVNGHQNRRAGLIGNDHTFQTRVDSEVIAHTVGELPDTIDDHDKDTYTVRGKLNYLLFSEDGILVRAQRKYDLTERFTMTCSRTDFENAEELGFEHARNEWMLVTPDGDEPDIETKERTYSTTTTSSVYNQSARQQRTSEKWRTGGTSESTAENTVTIEYDDLCPRYDEVTCIQVAPGVLQLRDEHAGVTEYIFRDREPELYYYYSDEQTPENIDQLKELADSSITDSEQARLEDLETDSDDAEGSDDTGNVDEAVRDATTTTVAEQIDAEDATDLRDRMMENFREAQEKKSASTGD